MNSRKNIKLPLKNKAVLHKVGRLKILEWKIENKISLYRVQCECNIKKWVRRSNLVNGTTRSCGDGVCSGKVTHGLFYKSGNNKNANRSDEYVVWDNLLRRANPKTKQSKRGFYSKKFMATPGVSASWISFQNFLKDMGKRPSKRHSIDRINNSKGYKKSNCRWATPKEQMRNTSRNVWYFIDNKKILQKDLCDYYGMSIETLKRRLEKGLTAQQAMVDISNKRNRLKLRRK